MIEWTGWKCFGRSIGSLSSRVEEFNVQQDLNLK